MTNKPTLLLVPLVGVHFHPPAKYLLPGLPAGLRLGLVPEPDNPYDEHAILVQLDPQIVPTGLFPRLDDLIKGSGMTMAEFCASGEALTLGHVGDSRGKICAKLGMPGNHEVAAMAEGSGTDIPSLHAALAFGEDGSPQIAVRVAEADDE